MSFEVYRQIFDGYEAGRTLRPGGKDCSFAFSGAAEENKRYRLFVVGETALFYQWKDEPDCPYHYRTIVDALDTEHAFEAQYCLDLSSKKPERYVRRLYKKIMWPPVLSYLKMNPVPEDWTAGLWVSTKNLKIHEGGYLRMKIDVRWAREGVNPHSVAFPPDETIVIDIPEGDCDWRCLSRAIRLKAERNADLGGWVAGQSTDFPASKSIAHVGVWIEGVNYSGEVYVERPFFTGATGENLLPDFTMPVPDKGHFDWTAQYLSRKEWPEFRVLLNGEKIFEGEVFERCHLDSEWEIDLPASLLKDENELSVQLISDYHDPLPYIVREVGVIEQPGGPVALIAASPAGVAGGKAYALIRTEKPDTRVRFRFPDGKLSGAEEIAFPEAGLNGVSFDCGAACGDARFEMEADGCAVGGVIGRIVEKEENSVVTGTGDLIYVEQRMDYVEEYLSWYISNGVGNLLTIRPTYRWSGTRLLNPEVWKLVTRVLNGMGIKYALMLDGRELPGISTNPDDQMLTGEGYLGSQLHERDGALFYWGQGFVRSLAEEQYHDMTTRAWQEDPAHTNMEYSPDNYFYHGNRIAVFSDPETPRDTKQAMERSVAQLAKVRGDSPRHTGPSVMFKYMLMAGYRWAGAETMYGSMEVLMAFLRGANLWKGIPDLGVHHAVQWSSSPQDAPEHFRRYRLALYVSHMQGATEINTEEGLWHLEEYYSHFHRFSKGCEGHMKQQADFYRYLATHSRTGTFRAPMALLHGRCDGWHGFVNHQPWGWTGEKNSDAENSWDLFKTFYPLSKPGDALYIHGCDTDHPVGYHSGTPLGNVDAIPVEGEETLYSRYGALAFMGYNCAEADDFARLDRYVRAGGKLILTRAHMTDTTKFADIQAGRLNYPQNVLSMTDGEAVFEEKTVNGTPVPVCVNALPADEVLAAADDGTPLIARYRIGAGEMILCQAGVYPAHPAIRSLYEEQLRLAMQELADAEGVWAECGDDVEFTAYDQADGSRHVYLLAVDWYRDPALIRRCFVRAGGYRYEARMPFGVMIKCVSDGRRAAWPHSEDGEAICLTEKGARVQGIGKVTFTLAKDGMAKEVEIDFAGAGVREIEF